MCPQQATWRPKFKDMFSIPREPQTSFAPGQHRSLAVPERRRVIVTDVYIENLGGGMSIFQILEQTGDNSYEMRYTFRTEAGGRTVINFTTGLRLGDLHPIRGSILFKNADDSGARIIVRVNGFLL